MKTIYAKHGNLIMLSHEKTLNGKTVRVMAGHIFSRKERAGVGNKTSGVCGLYYGTYYEYKASMVVSK